MWQTYKVFAFSLFALSSFISDVCYHPWQLLCLEKDPTQGLRNEHKTVYLRDIQSQLITHQQKSIPFLPSVSSASKSKKRTNDYPLAEITNGKPNMLPINYWINSYQCWKSIHAYLFFATESEVYLPQRISARWRGLKDFISTVPPKRVRKKKDSTTLESAVPSGDIRHRKKQGSIGTHKILPYRFPHAISHSLSIIQVSAACSSLYVTFNIGWL